MRRWTTALLVFVALMAIWEWLVRAGVWSPVLVPSPVDVGKYLVASIRDKTLLEASYVTLKRLLLGYAVGLVFGLPLGLLIARFKFFQDTLGLLALGFQTLPSVCWAPMALLWFGQTETAMFFIVIMGSIWSITLAADAGVRNVPPIYARAAQTMGSRGLHTWLKVILPASLPFIASGMKQGWAFAWRSLMAAEIYITILTGFGLGHLLHYGRELHAMDTVIGIMIVIVLSGLLTDKILFSPFPIPLSFQLKGNSVGFLGGLRHNLTTLSFQFPRFPLKGFYALVEFLQSPIFLPEFRISPAGLKTK